MISHEELIWKYLDGECTAEEKNHADMLMKSDSGFRMMYDQYSKLDSLLAKTTYQEPTAEFKIKLTETLAASLTKVRPVNQLKWIVSPAWLIILTGAGAIGLIVAGLSTSSSATVFQYFNMPDQRIFSMVTLVCAGFVLLTLLDLFLKKSFIKNRGVTAIMA